MKKILFFKTTTFTGATRVTNTIARILSSRFEVKSAVVKNLQDPQKEIREAISIEAPNILFCSFSSFNSDVIEIGKENKLTVVVRQDYNLKDLPVDIQKRIMESYPKADWIIAQTHEMKQELLEQDTLMECKIKVIDNPLDKEDILKKAAEPNPFENNGCYHFLWVGRKDPIKDLPTLQKAFEIVHRQFPNTDLSIVSEDPNPYRWMKYADCMVISSITEASPNVLREALFLGTKVVSTDCSPTVRKLLPKDRIAKVGCEKDLSHIMIRQIQ